ncbi:C-type lectin domain family 2 member D-like [Notechis scutatus]|uniref:C-type lectin domain family 2 member D-like n=1 Tax=Notechis scutatus TaxID=8663 RepID=A0A6J1VBX7_9SAUR|nr:C-type lectin domain family 2 member D-like [Notechis scutatus]XP_026540260.1 C-type lectin domain family 2 member D-like [Notechis scutatus]
MDKSFDRQHLEMTEQEENLRKIDVETDSGIYDPSTSEVTTDAKRARNASRSKACIPQCISDNKTVTLLICIIIVLVFIIIALIIKIVTLGKEEKSCPICAPCESFACPEICDRFRGIYIYTELKNWHMSSDICSSLNASLVVIDTQKNLDFLVENLNPGDYWFGLSKKDQVWKWPNGTEFTNQFPVEGEGACAYINEKGANSTICSMEKHFICSIPKHCRKAG